MRRLASTGRARGIVLILAGIAAGSLLSGPAVAHTRGNVTHLVNRHLVNFFYTETEADNRFINSNEKASDSDLLDGISSAGFLPVNGKAADADLLDGVSAAGFLPVNGKAADADKLDGADSTAFLLGSTGYIRHFSCAGTSFIPVDSTTTYAQGNASMIFQTFDNGDAFRCNAALPDGAIVTRTDFSVKDDDATDNVTNCKMLRSSLVPTIGTETLMAETVGTTGTPGDTQLADTSITSATIDNASFSYYIQCFLEGTDADVGLWGGRVTYTITGTNGGG